MVKGNLSDKIEDARWSEAAGTAAYLLEQPELVVQRATAATLILLSAQIGELLAAFHAFAGQQHVEGPFLLERGELFVDQPHVYEKKRPSKTPTEGFTIHRPGDAA